MFRRPMRPFHKWKRERFCLSISGITFWASCIISYSHEWQNARFEFDECFTFLLNVSVYLYVFCLLLQLIYT